MAWGLYAQRQCRFYDAVRPFLQCEAPDFAIELLSAPPVVLSRLLTNSWPTSPVYFAYVVELPLVFLWWWFVGTRLDFGLLGVGRYRHRRAWLSFLLASVALLLTLFGWSLWEDIGFYKRYSFLHQSPYLASIRNLRFLPLRLWLLILIFAFGLAAVRVSRGQSGQLDGRLASPRTIRLFGLGFVFYCVGAAGQLWHFKSMERQRQAEYDLHRIMIHGRVLDDRGSPVYAIKVELVPVLENGEVPGYTGEPDFTNEKGEYTLSPYRAGKYLLSVQWNAPPSPSHPFLTRYYPDVSDPKHAEQLDITPARHLNLNPIRLQRVNLARVPVSVTWSNGKPETDAYLLFMNTQYPEFGAIGSEALHPGHDGTVSLPIGFEYSATSQVDCDGGDKIKSAYTPRLTISLKSVNAPASPLHFVLPGDPCRVWHPK